MLLTKLDKMRHVRAHTHNMSTEFSTLAPASGVGVGKMLADALLSRPGFITLMADVAENGLKATTPRRWDKNADDWVSDPDFRVQTQTLFMLIAHMEGEPIKRIIHQHLGAGGKLDPLAILQESPATREALERLLQKSKWRDSGRNGKEAKAAEPATLDVG